MPFYIKQGDITTLSVDAIVNAANASLLGGGGVDGAIHRAAGPALREYCAGLGGCRVGEAKLSPGFALPARWIIHTVGPVWQGGNRNEEALLRACYRNSLALALETGCESVAFPLISAGVYGYPKEQALHVAIQEIGAFLQTQEMEVILTIYDPAGFRLSGRRFPVLRAMLGRGLPNDAFGPAEGSDWGAAALSGQYKAAACPPAASGAARPPAEAAPQPKKQQRASLFPRRRKEKQAESAVPAPAVKPVPPAPAAPAYADEEAVLAAAERPAALDERLRCLDESFSQMLLRKIDEKGMTDAACYKRANVDRKLFSKIRSDPGYRPSKPTAIAFAIALELPLAETRELLMKAGFALSPSSAFDVIIEYFISAGNYDIFEINEALFTFDQNLLGA